MIYKLSIYHNADYIIIAYAVWRTMSNDLKHGSIWSCSMLSSSISTPFARFRPLCSTRLTSCCTWASDLWGCVKMQILFWKSYNLKLSNRKRPFMTLNQVKKGLFFVFRGYLTYRLKVFMSPNCILTHPQRTATRTK